MNKFICLHCSGAMRFGDAVRKHRCPECGAAMAPERELLMEEDGRVMLDISDAAFHRWSACPSAWFCHGHDLYQPECEDPHFSPRCIHGLIREVDALSRAFSAVFHAAGNTAGSLRPPLSCARPEREEP